jgi:hypothetical protein
MEKNSLSTNGAGTTGYPHAKKREKSPDTPYILPKR